MGNHVVSPEEEKERLRWEGFAEKRFQVRNEREWATILFFLFYSKNPERYSASK